MSGPSRRWIAPALLVVAGLTAVSVAFALQGGGSPPPGPAVGAAPAGPPGPLGADDVPVAGQVGFRGDPASLKVISSAKTAPKGTRWMAPGFLQVDRKDLSLDGVFVKGGLDFYGTGTLTVANSIIEGGNAWMVVNAREVAAHLVVRDSTLRWREGAEPPSDGEWGNGAVHGASRMSILRNDISGTPDGIQNGPGDSVFEQNYIHDLAMVGTYPKNTHNDGIQLYGGPGLVIRNNRIDLGAFDPEHQNAAIFLQPGGGGAVAPKIVGNYLRGGGFVLRLEEGTQGAVVEGNIFGPLEQAFGYVLAPGSGAIQTWLDNTDGAGQQLATPTA